MSCPNCAAQAERVRVAEQLLEKCLYTGAMNVGQLDMLEREITEFIGCSPRQGVSVSEPKPDISAPTYQSEQEDSAGELGSRPEPRRKSGVEGPEPAAFKDALIEIADLGDCRSDEAAAIAARALKSAQADELTCSHGVYTRSPCRQCSPSEEATQEAGLDGNCRHGKHYIDECADCDKESSNPCAACRAASGGKCWEHRDTTLQDGDK